MVFNNAIVRLPGKNFSEGETSNLFGKPDIGKTNIQHEAYREALEHCGINLTILNPEKNYPDAPFVEDTAVVTDKFGLITNPGASSRKGEVISIQKALNDFYSELEFINPPGTLDGGDICQAEDHFFIGVSDRTNEFGATQLGQILSKYGYSSEIIDIRGVSDLLHLKSGMSYLEDGNLILVNSLINHPAFDIYRKIKVRPDEDYAANCVRINEYVLFASGFPDLANDLEKLGYALLFVEVSEFRKMDGGLSCLSLRF